MEDQIEVKIKKETKPVSLMVSKADKTIVKSDEDAVKATEFLVQISNKIKSLEDERQSYTKPLNESLRRLNTRFKELTEPLKSAERIVKDAIIGYKQKQEEKRLSQEAELRKKNGNKNIVVMDTLPDIIESRSGETRTTRRWVFDVIDETKIPRSYLTVDESKVNDAIKEGIREIKGLKIYQKEDISVYRG